MAAAMALGGFTGPEADTLGYAIRKKKSSVLRSMREQFVTQAVERGVRPEVIDAVFAAFQPFERYGFNKAHATCYGLVAYQTAYLKANFPVEYMTSVLTAFRDNAEKVAAAIAECRRLGIAVLPPDVHRSHLEFTVEGEAIRFGLLAVKNVGQGAIESIIAARESGGSFRSLTDFCSRIDLRLVNRKVLESLARVGALSAFGHPAQILAGLDDALAIGQASQRDRASGQTSLFDISADDSAALEKPLPPASEVPVRERLRWEKDLLGLYLSEHPMGEVAEAIGSYVTAYSGDLRDESLDGQRVVVGGIVTGVRTVVTKAKATMAIVALEDLQGTIEVVVFPRLYEETLGTWVEGVILLVSGRVDHRGEEVSLLADLALEWDAAAARGPEAFARDVAVLDRGRPRRGGPGAGRNGNGAGSGYGYGPAGPAGEPSEPVAVGPGSAVGPGTAADAPASGASVSPLRPEATVSPLRTGPRPSPVAARPSSAALPRIAPAEPVPLYPESPFVPQDEGRDDEPPIPDEPRLRLVTEALASTPPAEADPSQVLHVRFATASGAERIVSAMETVRAILRSRPGETRVVIHVPQGSGRDPLPMELRTGVAYDAELLAEVRRRLEEGIVELQLA